MTRSITHYLYKTFADTVRQQEIREIIRTHASNKSDIRKMALDGMDLGHCANILDLGCGYGFFTQALQGRIHGEAMITGIERIPGYRKEFLKTCESIGAGGYFYGNGIEKIYTLPSDAYDLALCSYSMYFFPEIVPEVSRLLKPEGYFIIISHASGHAPECIAWVRNTMAELGYESPRVFPYEELIARFDNTSGLQLLSPWFAEVSDKHYKSDLIFGQDDFPVLKKYFKYKRPYYFPGEDRLSESIARKSFSRLKAAMKGGGQFRITKDDIIFICSRPKKHVR